MIAQDHQVLLTQILDQANLFLRLKSNALIVVIRDIVIDIHRQLADRKKATLLGRDRNALVRMQVHGELHVTRSIVNKANFVINTPAFHTLGFLKQEGMPANEP